jgi:hypothetical protein
VKLPSELIVEHRKREVRKVLRVKRREARRAGEREVRDWQNYQDKLAHRARREAKC